MKKNLCITVLVFLLLLTGCSSNSPNVSSLSSQSESSNISEINSLSSRPDHDTPNVVFMNSMGCNDLNCTDTSHYHDCPTDCTDYDHYHNCALDCAEEEHHHSQTHHQDDHQTNSPEAITTTFISGMGCNDQNCTDVSHHHDCPSDCTEYDHYHHCNLDCAETSHHHGGQNGEEDHEEHHNGSHH